jgi:hypothetical protein
MVSDAKNVENDKPLDPQAQTTSAVFDRAAIWSGYNQTKLELILGPIVGLPPAHGTNYERHRSGSRPLKRKRLISFVRVFFDQGWLYKDDLIELGFADLVLEPQAQTTSTVFDRAADRAAIRSGYSQTKLELILDPIVGLPPAHGTSYGRHRSGSRPLKRERLISFVRVFFDQGWLNEDDLIELGLADTVGDVRDHAVDICKSRKKAYDRFLKGKDLNRKGLVPVIPGGPLGRVPRSISEISDEKAAEYYQSWIKPIESVGGRLTRCRCLYQCRCLWPLSSMWPSSREASCEEGLPDDWDPFCPVDVDGELVESIPAPRPLPDHHPSQVEKLRLWFGGRDYSAYPPPLCEWIRETSGDDLTEFLEERLRHRQHAEQQAATPPKHDDA